MKKLDFTTTIVVDQTPKEAFEAINNVRGWWSGEIEGLTGKVGDEFTYRYKDLHYSKQRLAELIPGKRVVWQVIESSINFVQDKNEWMDTKIIFDIAVKDDKTQIRFTHEGLIPQQECFEACSNAWTGYITDSLRNFISASRTKDQDFKAVFLVDQTPQEAFDAINNVRGWWSENIEGSTDKPGSEFKYHYEDVHRCEIRIIVLIPARKVVWLVMDNYFKFVEDQSEWKNTMIIFDIAKKDGQTEVRFTHQGLVPQFECYNVCNDAWTYFVRTSLRSLIATGKGGPTRKDEKETRSLSV
ncbi:SRPBCC family protein [Puia dinghuensis]|uniref:Activator of Hsp90 ATPase homologue 1/2-like C-terminal domain-containing protein n=1 Tax=Puia dinghuensis TaxID=1792502 RepID=A0A8J2XQF3_9BACT|nr:SRPBCC domain-containing protein [Puia dinghuensis]GGA84736.1 hypothetical protein GCM10011511_04710 [Puia dinghuensis]